MEAVQTNPNHLLTEGQLESDPRSSSFSQSVSSPTASSSAGSASQRAVPLQQNFCTICCEQNLTELSFIRQPGCGHAYCKECWRRHTLECMQQSRFPIRCLCLDCEQSLPSAICIELLTDPVDRLRYTELQYEAYIPADKRFYCPLQSCAKVIRADSPTDPPVFCPHCRSKICLRCQTECHDGRSCQEVQEAGVHGAVLSLAKDKRWRQCPSCRQLVEKKGGCNAIRCKCSHEFCYVCGKQTSACECWSRMTRSQRFWSVMGGTLLCCFCCPCVTTLIMWECCHHE